MKKPSVVPAPGLLVCLLAVGTHAAAGPLGAKWIWYPEATSSVNVPAGKRYFRQQVVMPGDTPIKSASCAITADNAFTVFINGQKIGAGDDWQTVYRFDAKPHLSPGTNVLAIEAINWEGRGENPAGLIARLRVTFDGGKPLTFDTDGRWKSSAGATNGWQAPGFDDSRWRPARVVDWGGWGSVALSAGSLRTHDPLVEPETRTRSPDEAEAIIIEEWLFQAEGKPLDQRAAQEIHWAREMAARLAGADPAPHLNDELARLGTLEGNPQNLSPEELYLAVRAVKRRLMFKDPLLDFSRLVFIDVPERYPHESMHRVYPQAQLNSVRLLMLDGLHPGGNVRKVTQDLGPGWYWRPDVSYDGQRIVFCFRPKEDKTFHLYEVNTDGSDVRQLTDSSYDDQDPVYMPDGHIVFVSNRGCSHARCVVGHPSTVVARCDPDGKNIYLISSSNEPEYTPAVMPSGRILYTRWEYTDKELMRIQSLWTMNPDGTGVHQFWGNQSYWPDMLLEARPIPGSHRVMFAGHGHHNVYWGSIGIVDPNKGQNYPDGLTKVTQDVPWCEVGDGPQENPETPDYHTAGAYRGYKSPYPLSEELFLVSARHAGKKSKYKLFLMDVYGNREVIYEGAFHALYAIPVRPRLRPPVVPDRVKWAGAQKNGVKVEPGSFYCADIYQGAPEILRGKAKYLRVIQLKYNTMTIGKKYQDAHHTRSGFHMHAGPVVSAVVNDGVKNVLGTVPIEEDDSVCFEAPACVPLHFQLLDEHHRALHTMRSFTSVMPGEQRGCVGCHESQHLAPPSYQALAMSKPPARLVPYAVGPNYSLGYER
ncbi:MAG: PD40 domain-containing protein, partial [Phycisphaerales bacterium]